MRFLKIILVVFFTGLGCSHKKLPADDTETSPPEPSGGSDPDFLPPRDSASDGVETDSVTDRGDSDSDTIGIEKDTSTSTEPPSTVPDTETDLALCINGRCPDDDNLCNGQEVCDPLTGTCLHVNPLRCENDLLCDGAEICDPLLGCLDAPDVVCPERQVCREPNGNCVCEEGRFGEDCIICDTVVGYIEWPPGSGLCIEDPCNPDPCDHGVCRITSADGFACDCEGEWSGPTCAFLWEQFGDPNAMYDLDIDDTGRVFIATQGGLLIVDSHKTPFDVSDDQHLSFGLRDGLLRTPVHTVALDQNRRGVWIGFGAMGGGAVFLSLGGTPFDKTDDQAVAFTEVDGLGNDEVYEVVIDPRYDEVWFLSDGDDISRLDCGGTPFDKNDDQWAVYHSDIEQGMSFHHLTMAMDGAGGKWFGNDTAFFDSVYYLDDRGTPFDLADDHWTGYDLANFGVDSGAVYSLLLDENGDKWLGMYGDLIYLDDSGTPTETADDRGGQFTRADGLGDAGVTDLVQDLAGGLWVVQDPSGLNYFDYNDSPLEKTDDVCTPYAAPVIDIAAFGVDADNGKWGVSSWGDGLFYLDDGGTPTSTVDDAWQRFSFFDGPGNIDDRIDAVDRRAGGQWIVSEGGVLYFDDGGTPLDRADDRWEYLKGYETLFNDGDDIVGVSVDPDNGKWLRTRESGILYLDDGDTPYSVEDDEWIAFTRGDGLASDTVNAVAFDDIGGKWFGTTGGVSYLADQGTPMVKSDDEWVTFTARDGLVNDNVASIAVGPDGAKWFGGGPPATADAKTGLAYLLDRGTPLDKNDDEWAFFEAPEVVSRMVVDDDRGVWFNDTYLQISGTPGEPDDDVWIHFARNGRVMARDDDGGLWCAKDNQLVYFDPEGTPADNSDDTRHEVSVTDWFTDRSPTAGVVNVVPDPSGGAWVSLRGGLAFVYRE